MRIVRFKQNSIGTWGRLFLPNGFECFTFEPLGEDEIRSGLDRRIPEGLYSLRWHDSPRFKIVLPHLYNEVVPKSRYILIHSGNLPGHTEGCILVGYDIDERGIWNSKAALNEFLHIIRGAHAIENGEKLEIINDFNFGGYNNG